MQLEESMYKSFRDSKTGRKVIQLTSGRRFCYPLYYYIPTITKDLRYLVYHSAAEGQVQLYCLDLKTGKERQLTSAGDPEAWWKPWCTDPGSGVLDHRSVLDTENNLVIFIENNTVYSIDLNGGNRKKLFEMPSDRMFIGQNCITPDGKYYIFIHADRKRYESLFDENKVYRWNLRGTCAGTSLCRYEFSTGKISTIVNINSPIHHVIPYNNKYLVFCHPADEDGMLWTDIHGGWYSHLRTLDDRGGAVCHYLCTKRGIMYEVQQKNSTNVASAGIYNPFNNRKFEIEMPEDFGYTHTGLDPQGDVWFFEEQKFDYSNAHHCLYWLEEYCGSGENKWVKLLGDMDTFGGGQKSHFHPVLLRDRNWILMTGGDKETGTNHIFLVDARDLTKTRSIESVGL